MIEIKKHGRVIVTNYDVIVEGFTFEGGDYLEAYERCKLEALLWAKAIIEKSITKLGKTLENECGSCSVGWTVEGAIKSGSVGQVEDYINKG